MAHIGEESAFQAVGRFGFLFGIDQFGFGFFQLRDIIVYADKLDYSVFRLKLVDYHVGAYPVPLVFCSRTQDTHLSLEIFHFAETRLIEEVQHLFSILRMHLAIYFYDFRQGNVFIFSHILIPLLDGITFLIQQIQLCITHFRIIGNQQEEVLKIAYAAQSVYTLGIINID